ncbi:glycosyltransferase family 4 protein [Rhodanobacter sp. MP7CTX1]|uniref:glycosyltransferase family 4 protein n=1 Tax=Rhodanobacter sp. MP7CTX1 TaxID=2723084 RepID=UPI00161665CA|nr:glycosyltransferase family 4 protein [Rhodanobacter sp. MP7CTX1]MBB6186043.1 glycosyltransferase involved in cell wall biosynthesis [Rhodanobacter sp. MP7CTX1]
MAALHVAQINFLQAPAGLAHDEVLERWHSLVDIAEVAASGGTRVTVVQASARDDVLTRNGIDYHFIDIRGLGAAGRGRRFARLLADIKADVLHANGLDFVGDAFAVSQCLPQLPILVQDHASRPPRWWRRPRWRRWYAAVSGVAFTALEQAQPFSAAGLFGPQLRLFAIPESSSRFAPGNRADARVETGLYGDPCVLWVGHLSPGKDPLTVLDGVARAASELPDLQLWCAFGSAPLFDEVEQRIEQDPQLRGRVHLLGKVAHTHVEALMQSADVFVSGSHHEGSGYALLEALACGAVPVVTDIPSFRALTDNGRVGKLWPCGDATRLAEALVDLAASRPSSQQVRAHFDAALSFAAVGRRWADAYAQVHGDRQRRAS